MKKIGYLVFAMFYYLFRMCGVKRYKVFCVMTHDASEEGNVGVVIEALRKSGRPYRFTCVRDRDRGMSPSFLIMKPYHMATSKYVLLDNAFLPMAFLRFPKGVKVVQLWHGTGTVKKFGLDANADDKGKFGLGLGALERRANAAITHLIVNSEYTKKQYQGAFGVSEDKVFVLGLPRTDALLNEEGRRDGLARFHQKYPYLKGKTLLLYAPTFRDNEVERPKMGMDLEYVSETLPEHMVLLLRMHPHVAKAYKDGKLDIMNNIINVSGYSDLNHILFAADALITDYSSIIFEYCLLERPMYFFAYDLDEFGRSGRGFYENYESYVPGPVSRDTKELFTHVLEEPFDKEMVKRFKEESYRFLDGKSTERLLKRIFHL